MKKGGEHSSQGTGTGKARYRSIRVKIMFGIAIIVLVHLHCPRDIYKQEQFTRFFHILELAVVWCQWNLEYACIDAMGYLKDAWLWWFTTLPCPGNATASSAYLWCAHLKTTLPWCFLFLCFPKGHFLVSTYKGLKYLNVTSPSLNLHDLVQAVQHTRLKPANMLPLQ